MVGYLRDGLQKLEAETGETIISIVVSKIDGAPFGTPPASDENSVLSREAGLEKLDQEYENEFARGGNRAFFAWTKSWVLFRDEHDGSTWISRLPRNPVDCEPQIGGIS